MFRTCLSLLLAACSGMPLLAQPPSVKFHPDEWPFSWCERLTDGGYFAPVFDAPECRAFNATMHQTAAWQYVDPMGGLPVVYFGVHNGPVIISYGVVRYDPPPGIMQTKMAVTRVTTTGGMIDQNAFLFEGFYQEYMAAGGAANVKLATNPFGETFVQLRSTADTGDVSHILKIDANGQPQWQVAFPASHYLSASLEADFQGGCWFTTASTVPGQGELSFQIGRLDADGNTIFWNDYRRPGATYRDHCTVRSNQPSGFIAVGMEDNRIFWMRMNDAGLVGGYRLTSAFEPPNVLDAVGGVVRVDNEWAVLQGVANDRMVFFDLDGVFQRAFVDSVQLVNDTLHKWMWSTVEGHAGWAMLTGAIGTQAPDGSTYDHRTTLTQLKEGLWDHCLVQPANAEQEVVPLSAILVQALGAPVHVPLPQVIPGDLIVEMIPTFPDELLCAPYLTTGIAERAFSMSPIAASVVSRGEPFRLPCDRPGHVWLRDMLGREVFHGIQGTPGTVDVPTDGLSAGAYLLVFTEENAQVALSQQVMVIE